jgi:hypothetical protein
MDALKRAKLRVEIAVAVMFVLATGIAMSDVYPIAVPSPSHAQLSLAHGALVVIGFPQAMHEVEAESQRGRAATK